MLLHGYDDTVYFIPHRYDDIYRRKDKKATYTSYVQWSLKFF